MKLIKQHWHFARKPMGVLRDIEYAARMCYKSHDNETTTSREPLIRSLIKSGHHSVLEHVSASVEIVTNRGVSHELVRHRLASYSQESTRYVDYKEDMEFIKPAWYNGKQPGADHDFWWACTWAETYYKRLRRQGWRPEQAREVLPNALATSIIMTCNMREWRHVFSLRCSNKAHPQMRELMRSIYLDFAQRWPVLFEDITWGIET